MDPERLFPPPSPYPRRRMGAIVGPQNKKEATTSVVGRTYYFRRCKMVEASSIESLPNELLIEILVRLPADELFEKVRFVCRNWYNIIHNDAFMDAHRENSNSNWGLLLIIKDQLDIPLFLGVRHGRIELSKLNCNIFSPSRTSCNGLVMAKDLTKSDLHNIHFVNLATKQAFSCPPSRPDKVKRCTFGMAYAAASMGYKVVRTYNTLYGTSIFCDILTVGVDIKWRSVGVDNLPCEAKKLLLNVPLITPGFMHWTQGWKETRVLTLNAETEMFTESHLPLLSHPDFAAYPGRRRRCKIYVSTGMRLCLFSFSRKWVWEVWEMEGESGEWIKFLPNIDLEAHTRRCRQEFPCEEHVGMRRYNFICGYCRGGILEPLGWVKYPVLLALSFVNRCMVYNLATDEIDFTIELPYPFGHYNAVAHRNTLEWLR